MAAASSYRVLVKIGLPVFDENGFAVGTLQKEPDDIITADEFAQAQQSADQIAALVEGAAIEEA